MLVRVGVSVGVAADDVEHGSRTGQNIQAIQGRIWRDRSGHAARVSWASLVSSYGSLELHRESLRVGRGRGMEGEEVCRTFLRENWEGGFRRRQ